jgi:hypothetical protein
MPSGLDRSSATDRLPRLAEAYMAEMSPTRNPPMRVMSPIVMGSTLMTSAP